MIRCYSYVGRGGGRQLLSVGNERQDNCRKHGVLLHELGHTIGFYHEQSRIDRDNYIRILTDNIHPEVLGQFSKHSHKDIDSLGVPYDYDSIMHYSRYVRYQLLVKWNHLM